MINSQNTVITNLIDFLKQRNGRATAVEVCRDVLGFANCDETLAVSLVKSGLPPDDRIKIENSGGVKLCSKKAPEVSVSHLPFAVIDIEATSLPSPKNRMTEFAAVLIDSGSITEQYTTLVNPELRIPRYVRQMTGITQEMVKKAPVFNEVADAIVQYIGDRIIVAHNSQFDIGLLNFELNRTRGYSLKNPSLCTVRLARKLQPGLAKYRLGDLAEFFDIEIEDRHRALADAAATAKIFIRLLDIASEKGWSTWAQFDKAAGARNGNKSKEK